MTGSRPPEGTADTRSHWQDLWSETAPDETSWYQPRPAVSLELIDDLGLSPEARVLDVGGGASTLVDHLLEKGFSDLAVLDVAGPALEKARQRLGERAERVRWIEADVLEADLDGGIELWHDRAVFHFRTDAEDRASYVERLASLLCQGGYAIVATFSPEGPEQCSGLPVRRYDAQSLADELGGAVELLDARREDHVTPWETTQSFQYAVFEHVGPG